MTHYIFDTFNALERREINSSKVTKKKRKKFLHPFSIILNNNF